MSDTASISASPRPRKVVERMFDSHFHVIDPRFPLVPNHGFLPAVFTVDDYLQRTEALPLVGGAVVSGSFQNFDQGYLLAALARLGPAYVGVTQLPTTVTDEEILKLNRAGVRGVRFNLRRGGSEGVDELEGFAHRVHEVAGWHVELYVDARDLAGLWEVLLALPAVSVDHLGLSEVGFHDLLELAERGVRVKATGFGRVDFDVGSALKDLHAANPESLMFGTDLPSTRAPRPFVLEDIEPICEVLGDGEARRVFYSNAVGFYRLQGVV